MPLKLENLYHYRAEVVEVHDGDTCTLNIDLGFGIILKNRKVRLARINAPELITAGGHISKGYLGNMIGSRSIVLQTIKDRTEKYGRLLGEIWLEDKNVNDEMLKAGYAEIYQ